tara:strand:- start:294 stop:1343 length:1050 start_codon:yes stop_codon:yes gene_type:complete
MKNIKSHPNISLRQAMKNLSESGHKCLVIVDENDLLLGTLSDGDIRNAILKGMPIRESIESVFQKEPTALIESEYDSSEARKIFIENNFDLIPIVNKKGCLTDILFMESALKSEKQNYNDKLDLHVIIMAGGLGKRMEPFTYVLPKPLIPIQEKPIIEHIVERFTKVGCMNFHLTVNYKSKILKAYFDELKPPYNVSFIDEVKPLGTAGSLRYLKGQFTKPFFVTNCDIIIKADYKILYDFHLKGNYDLTLVASMKEYVIPYGSCELNSDGSLLRINEKPEYDFLINTGLYVLNSDIINLIPKNKLYHITNLIEDAKEKGKRIGVFPIDDDAWIDVGQWAEYRKVMELI